MIPPFESALPLRVAPAFKLIAPSAITVPLKTELSPRVNAPPTCQYTLHKDAELIRVMLENVPVDKAPPTILNINNELGLPFPSKVKFPLSVEAPPRQ